MKSIITLAIAACAFSSTLISQSLPKPSPWAKTEQRIGLSDVSIEYSRPGVKDRTIWGELVPYDEIWRAGANKATQFVTNGDIEINGKVISAGSYSFFLIPSKEGNWTAIFNTETELWGTGNYNKDQDKVRIDVVVKALPNKVERLEYRFLNVDMNSGLIVMEWENKQVVMNVTSDPTEQVKKNIETALEEAKPEDKWKVYRSAASYASEQPSMTKQGLEWIKKSTELKESWYSYWVYAELLANNNDATAAVAKANKAIEIGKKEAEAKGEAFNYEDRIKEDIDRWSAK